MGEAFGESSSSDFTWDEFGFGREGQVVVGGRRVSKLFV